MANGKVTSWIGTIVGVAGIGFGAWQMIESQKSENRRVLAEEKLLEAQEAHAKALEEAQVSSSDLSSLLNQTIERIKDGQFDLATINVDQFRTQINSLVLDVYQSLNVPKEEQFRLISDGFEVEEGSAIALVAPTGKQRILGVETAFRSGRVIVNFGQDEYGLKAGDEFVWELDSQRCYVGFLGLQDPDASPQVAKFFLRCEN